MITAIIVITKNNNNTQKQKQKIEDRSNEAINLEMHKLRMKYLTRQRTKYLIYSNHFFFYVLYR